MGWRVEFLDESVQADLLALPSDMQARYLRIVEMIEASAPMMVREPYAKPLGAGLYEIRMTGRDGIARAVYVTARPERVVVVLVFVKKTQKTPDHVLKLAKKRAKEVKDQ
jgi:phage-related protein